MEQQPKKFSRVTASIVTILGTLGLACQAQKPAATVQALIFRWTKTANHGKLILGAAGQ
jgi:hypothetical protein